MKKLVFTITGMVIFLWSCSTDNGHPAGPKPDPDDMPVEFRIKQIESASGLTHYQYNDDNLLERITNTDGGYSQYAYTPQSVEQTVVQQDGFSYTILHELNEKGLRDRSTSSKTPDAETRYEYNSEGQVVKITDIKPQYAFVHQYHYSPAGNVDSVVYFKNDAWLYTYIYSYYLDQPNMLSPEIYGVFFSGHKENNLLKEWHSRLPDGGSHVNVSFTYTFDQQGRVATNTQTNNGISTTRTYTYY